jgi:hypothetical protein
MTFHLDTVGKSVLRVIKRYSIDYTFKRFPAGTYINGRWNTQTPADVTIKAHIQPLSGKEKQEVPEGRRENNAIRIYAQNLIKGVDVENKTQPDQVVYESKNYEVYNAKNWIGVWYKALGLEVER